MSLPFTRYARWYDLFYSDKDYGAEAEYVLGKVKSVGGEPRRWLDIGCGTGRHVAHLRSLGIDAAGIDRSDAMIAVARRLNEGVPFYGGRAEDVTLPGEWDIVSMLFHVIDYQVSDAMVHDALTAARRFLVPHGILVFDFWNSDAVLRDPPARRVREIETEGRLLYRLTLPVAGHHSNGIDVRYEFRWDSPTGPLEHEELHAMRHFSEDELTRLLRSARLRILSCNAWMQDCALSSTDWYGLICACLADRNTDSNDSAAPGAQEMVVSPSS